MRARAAAAVVVVVLVGLVLTGTLVWWTERAAKPAPTPAQEPPRNKAKTKAKRKARAARTPTTVDLSGRPPAPEGAVNVVIVLGCTLRRDQLTPYGGPANTTPFLAELARDGVRFDDLVSSSSWTKESTTALFTGHQAHSIGMTEPGVHHSKRRLSERIDTLAERFTRAGWVAVGVTANPHLNRVYGLAQGYDRYHDTATRGFTKRHKLDGQEVVRITLEMLDHRSAEEAARPLFARVVLIDPHYPLVLPDEEVAPFLDEAPNTRVARYRAGVRRTDEALRALDTGLRERGYTEENTLLVLVTDHGEGLSMPEHHRGQHGRVLYPTLTVVPWVMRGPGLPGGHVVEGLASHLDFSPTMLSLVGLPHDELTGNDLSAQVRGSGATTPRTRAYTETWYYGADRAAVFTPTQACQLDWGSRGVPNNQFVNGCFDRSADPDFTEVIAVPDLNAELIAWRAARQAEYDAWPDTADAEDDELKRQLEALGYAE